MDELTCFFRVLYEKKDISHVLSTYLISISYTDHLSGQADELSIELENIDGRWSEQWYPGLGDSLTLELGWDEKSCRKIGRFDIDEIEFQFAPATVSIRALAAGVNHAVRTKAAYAYENMTLDKVISQVARRQGLEVVGLIEPIALDRLTQQESDLEFLAKQADEYDYAFKLSDNKLIFYTISELEKSTPVCSLTLKDIESGHIRDQIKEVPKNVEVKSHNPATNKTVIIDIKNNTTRPADSNKSKTTTSSDSIKTNSRSSSVEVATAKAKAELLKANRQRTTGNITLKGQPHFLSGNVIELKASGLLNGHYLIISSQHSIDRSGGYVTDLELSRVKAPLDIQVKQETADSSKKLVVYNVKQHDEDKPT